MRAFLGWMGERSAGARISDTPDVRTGMGSGVVAVLGLGGILGTLV